MTNDEAKAFVAKHASELAEMFDSVRIFVCWPHGDDEHQTLTYDCGRGNWFACYGQIRQWLIAEEEYQRLWAAKKAAEDE